MFNAVIYRYNPALAARVANAGADFVHEFPASFSLAEIKQGLDTVMPDMYKAREKARDESLTTGDCKLAIHVDGTVLSAGGRKLEQLYPKLIQQDDVNAYDRYAEHIAEEAKRVNQSEEPMVVIVRDRIADHNSECGVSTRDAARDAVEGVALMDAEHAVTHRWVNRLQKHGVRICVIAARWFEMEVRHKRGVRKNNGYTRKLRDVVVVCDHHNGDLKDLIRDYGGTWFNAFPPYSDSNFLSA